jgi:hypothetical protein
VVITAAAVVTLIDGAHRAMLTEAQRRAVLACDVIVIG